MRCRRRQVARRARRPKSPVSSARRAVLLGLAVAVALAVLVGWLGFRAYQSTKCRPQRSHFLQVARQGALNLTTIDWQKAEGDVQRILDGATDSSTTTSPSGHGYRGTVAETVAINPALAISGVELINQWYYNPAYFAIMADCAHTQTGVWSENSLDRTVVVAVYGKPEVPVETGPLGPEIGLPPRSGPRREFCVRSQPGLRRQRRDRVRHRLVPLDPEGRLPAAGLSAELAAAA